MSCKGCSHSKIRVERGLVPTHTLQIIATGEEQVKLCPGLITSIQANSKFQVLIRDCCTAKFKLERGAVVTIGFIEEKAHLDRQSG
jgi:hypothetical protein